MGTSVTIHSFLAPRTNARLPYQPWLKLGWRGTCHVRISRNGYREAELDDGIRIRRFAAMLAPRSVRRRSESNRDKRFRIQLNARSEDEVGASLMLLFRGTSNSVDTVLVLVDVLGMGMPPAGVTESGHSGCAFPETVGYVQVSGLNRSQCVEILQVCKFLPDKVATKLIKWAWTILRYHLGFLYKRMYAAVHTMSPPHLMVC